MPKTTMNNPIVTEIEKQINRATDIALFCHTNPDCDALGSMLALYLALKKKGKNVSAYCDTPVPERLKVLAGSENVTFPQKRVHELAISLDCSDLDRLGQCMKSFLSAKKQIAIDHHVSFKRFASICLVDSDAGACGEIVYELIKNMKSMDKDIAQLLFAAIVTDTGCFAQYNATRRSMEIACELMKFDFDAQKTIYEVYKSTSIARFKLKNLALSRTKFFEGGKIALIYVSMKDLSDTGANQEDADGIIGSLLDIDTVKVAYSLLQVGERNFKLSIRTKDGVDASDIANVFGGGGHVFAAGCRVNGYFEDIVEKLVRLASDRMI